MLEGLRKPVDLIVIVVTLLTYGCPIQAIVYAFGLDERTVADWRDRAGVHCQQVHQEIIEQGQLDLMHVQADEIRVKGCKMMAWMGLAMMVSTRLWLGGVVQLSRDRGLADQMPVPGAPMRGVLAPPAGVDRRLERLSGQHPPSVPREGQANGGSWTSVLAGLAPVAHWHGDQANAEQTGCRDHAAHGSWSAVASGETADAIARRQRPQHGVYRALEWNLSRTTGELDPQISSRGPSPASA